jgi:8-oxo-dGTP pyrophosphatase MutT (NUDIX family)
MGGLCEKCPFIINETVLVVVRNHEGKWLVVNETGNRGWSLPGGHVDPPEYFLDAAVREVEEEAGITVEIKGLLREEYEPHCCKFQKRKIMLYGEPVDREQRVKTTRDKHSIEARWVTIPEMLQLREGKPGWRREDLYHWALWLEKGGKVTPLYPRARIGDAVESKKEVKDEIEIKKEEPTKFV